MLCPATRRKCTAEPRSAKDKRSLEKSGEGGAQQSLERRRRGRETHGPAKDRQRTDAQRRGTAQLGQASNRMAAAQPRYATRSEGKARYGSVMAKQSRGLQRRWTDTGSEGVALRSRAWRRQSGARRSGARRRQSSSEICRATALKCNITRRRSPARQRKGEAKHSSVRDGKALRSQAVHGNGNAARRYAS